MGDGLQSGHAVLRADRPKMDYTSI